MNTNKIEHYDALRYRAMMTLMIGWIFMQFFSIPIHMVNTKAIYITMALLQVVAAGVMAIGLVKLLRVGKKINSDTELREALGDELYVSNSFKAIRYGFLGFIGICCLMLLVALICRLPEVMSIRIVLFAGITTFFVSWLVLNKRERYAGE